MAANLKPLRYQKFDDLETDLPNLKKCTVSHLIKTASEMFDLATRHQRDGDQELSYTQYHKYFAVVHYIRTTKEYASDRKFHNLMLGVPNKLRTAIEQMEVLNESLKRRYSLQNSGAVVVGGNDAAATRLAAGDTDRFGRRQTPSPIRPSSTSNNGTASASDGGASHHDADIDVLTFVRLLQDKQTGVLVMDCRPAAEFEASRIAMAGVQTLNVPAELVKPGLSAGKIQRLLSAESKPLWASRSIKDHVILMDWRGQSADRTSTISMLKTILLDWDPDASYKNPVRCLAGGYENFLLTYPMHTTDAHFQPAAERQRYSAAQTYANDALLVERIEYDDIRDIQMKDQIRRPNAAAALLLPEALRTPAIDRSSKVAALQVYGQRLAATARDSERSTAQSMETIRELGATIKRADRVDPAQAVQLQSRLTELEYRLMQLDDERESFEEEIKEISQTMDVSTAAAADHSRPFDGDDGGESAEERLAREQTQRALLAHRRQQEELARERSRLDPLLQQRRNEEQRRLVADQQRPSFDRAAKPTVTAATTTVTAGSGSVAEGDEPSSWHDAEDRAVRYFDAEPGGEGPGLTGLKNLGNTCYMNSIMQCLSNTAALREFFVSDEGYRKQFRRSSQTQRQIADEVSAVMREIWTNKHRHIASNDLRRVVGQCEKIFCGSEQQDSHEFLTILMDRLHLDLRPQMDRIALPPVRTPAEAAWQEFTKCKESYIVKLFYGQIKSTVKCMVCGSESATFEGFSNLSLQLPEHSNRCTLTECLEMYFFGEQIHGWNCPKCKQKRTAVKKLDISKLPPILVIHFKRFNADPYAATPTYKKKTNSVRFPLADVDMLPYVAPSERQSSARVKNATVFDLYGVSNHYGEINRGHYTAFCKSSHYNKWYKYDDHNVSRMDSSDVCSSAAYILFYATKAMQR